MKLRSRTGERGFNRRTKAAEALVTPEQPSGVMNLERALTPHHLAAVETEINLLADDIERRQKEPARSLFQPEDKPLLIILYGLQLAEQTIGHELIDPAVRARAKRHIDLLVGEGWSFNYTEWRENSSVEMKTVRLHYVGMLLQFDPGIRSRHERDPRVFADLKEEITRRRGRNQSAILAWAQDMLVVWPERRDEIQALITDKIKDWLIKRPDHVLFLQTSYLNDLAAALLIHPEWRTELSLDRLDWKVLNILPALEDEVSIMQHAAPVAIITAEDARVGDDGVIVLTPRRPAVGVARPLPVRPEM